MAAEDYPVVRLADSTGTVINPATGSGGGGASGGSVTAPGTPGTQAQTIQGNANGVPVPVTVAAAAQKAVRAEGGGTTSATVSTSTTVLAADASRTKFEFQNLGTATIVLRINQGADTTAASTATPTTKRMIAVPAGQLYVTEPDTLCTGQINVASATASVPFSYLAS